MKDEDYYKESHGGTQDERLLETPHADEFLHTDTWRVFRIMGEFVQGFEDLAHINNGVAVFVITKGGLMAGIAVGGQKIKFEPMSK